MLLMPFKTQIHIGDHQNQNPQTDNNPQLYTKGKIIKPISKRLIKQELNPNLHRSKSEII